MVKSMYAAVAGLRTHQAKMDVIGNNIANVNTYGFKKARATFRDQFYATTRGSSEAGAVYGGGNPSQVGYGTSLSSIEVDFGTASGAPTGNGTDVMVNGNGFFMVGGFAPGGYAAISNTEGLNLTSLYFTRIGIFNLDGQGNLVDSLRNHVYGYADGSPLTQQAAGATTAPARKIEAMQAPWVLYDSASGRPLVHDETSAAAAATAWNTAHNLTGTDALAAEDFIGKAVRISWQTTGTAPNVQYALDEDGNKIPTLPTPLPVNPATDAAYAATEVYTGAMKLVNVTIGADGSVIGVNQDTEEVVTLGRIALADLPNPNALENTSDGYYKAKNNTGVITAEVPGEGSTGALNSGRLEMANVDLAQEFTDMITTQRGFQANGRIITVTDEMLAELVNLKR